MNVKSILDIKGRAVATISPEASLADAAHMLADKKIGAIVVTGTGLSVAGMVSGLGSAPAAIASDTGIACNAA